MLFSRKRPRATVVISFLMLMALTACASTNSIRVYESSQPKAKFVFLGVSSVQLLYESKFLENSLRTHRLLELLAEQTNWPIIPPNEFEVINALETDPIRKTDLLLRLKPKKDIANRIALLDTTVSFREAKGRSVINTTTGKLIGKAHDLDVVVRMTVSGEKGRILFDAELVTRVDPFAITPDYDTRNYIDTSIIHLAQTLIDEFDRHIVQHSDSKKFIGHPTIQGLKSYQKAFSVKPLNSPSLQGMDLDIRHWHILQHFAPETAFDEARSALQQETAYCLTRDASEVAVYSGDCILSIEGKKVANSHQIRMVTAASKQQSFRLRVKRHGTEKIEDVTLAR